MWQGWICGLIGLWLIVVPFFNSYPSFYAWNNFICGLIVGIIGLSMVNKRSGQGWVLAAAGLWLIIATFIYDLQVQPGVYFNDVISGLVISIAGFSAVVGTAPQQRRMANAPRTSNRPI